MSAQPVKGLFPMVWLILGLITAAIAIPILGLQRLTHTPITEPTTETKPVAKAPVRVVALGRIEPTSGVIQVGGPINEILGRLLIKEGDLVTKGQIIGYLRSYDERRSELETAQQQLQTARARLVTNTQFSEAQERERTIDSAKVPLVQNSGIAAQQAQIDALQSQRSLALKELARYQFLVNQGAAPRNEIDQRQSEVEQLNQRIRQAQETLAQLINSRDRELANVNAQINTARINTARIQAENDVASAKQAIELAQVKLDNTIIRSPVSGRILRIVTKAGESIGDQGQGKGTLVEVADTSAMQVVAEVSESDIRLVKPGQIAKIVSRNKAFEGTLTGRVTELGRQIFKNNVLNDDPSAFTDARVIQVKVAIEDSEAVAKFTNLQVDVQIEVQGAQPSPTS